MLHCIEKLSAVGTVVAKISPIDFIFFKKFVISISDHKKDGVIYVIPIYVKSVPMVGCKMCTWVFC